MQEEVDTLLNRLRIHLSCVAHSRLRVNTTVISLLELYSGQLCSLPTNREISKYGLRRDYAMADLSR